MTQHNHLSNPITPAQINWRSDDNGHTVPVSCQFGDVYYSLVDGLAESRYVFIEHNQLPERFAQCMQSEQDFTIAELGFGTGLNFLATWQLWQQQLKKQPLKKQQTQHDSINQATETTSQLHYISFEKYPLSKADFARSLDSWKQSEPALVPLIDQLIDTYPTLVAGCHRLSFFYDNLTLDLWFGDAQENLTKLSPFTSVDAWFLDGFAPSCNESLWVEQIFAEVARLSDTGSTVATFSCAGIVKRGLKNIGFDIKKVKGFGRKREMLTAKRLLPFGEAQPIEVQLTETQFTEAQLTESQLIDSVNTTKKQAHTKHKDNIAVIGAGVAGLMTAWSLANRGYQITLIDKIAPLAGASGNPRGLLAPKMTPIQHVDEHLHSIGYLYSSRLFRQLSQSNIDQSEPNDLMILEPTGALDLLIKANITTDKINAYPTDFAQVLNETIAKQRTGLSQQNLSKNQFLPQAGLINPQALAHRILQHPRINFQQQQINHLKEQTHSVILSTVENEQLAFAHAVVCLAYESCQLDQRIFDFRKIRGQLSWFIPTKEQLAKLPKLPLKYGGYCAQFIPQQIDISQQTEISQKQVDNNHNTLTADVPHFLIGASFVRNDMDKSIRTAEHQQNRDKLVTAIPELEASIPTDCSQWQARVGIRSQTPDYHPLVGQVADSLRVWTLSGMGAKGYAFAPICAEVLADMITNNIPAISQQMLTRLDPNRQRLQVPLQKS